MLAWVSAAALVCAISTAMGFGSFLLVSPSAQGIALLVAALSALVMLGGFEAYDAEGPRPEGDD